MTTDDRTLENRLFWAFFSVIILIILSLLAYFGIFGDSDYEELSFQRLLMGLAFVISIFNILYFLRNGKYLRFAILILMIPTLVVAFLLVQGKKENKEFKLLSKTSSRCFEVSENNSCIKLKEYMASLVLRRINLSAKQYYQDHGYYPIETENIINQAQWNELADTGLPYSFQLTCKPESLIISAIPKDTLWDTLIMINGETPIDVIERSLETTVDSGEKFDIDSNIISD